MTVEKSTLHPRNLHQNSYDFEQLISCVPELKHYVFINSYGTPTINFSIPKAVKLLNKALLQHFYAVKSWDIPEHNLCPPIPGVQITFIISQIYWLKILKKFQRVFP